MLFKNATNYYGMNAEQVEEKVAETPQETTDGQGQQEETVPDND